MKTSLIPRYYAANVERLKRFAALMIETEKKNIARNEAAARAYVADFYRRKLAQWEAIAANPAAFVNA